MPRLLVRQGGLLRRVASLNVRPEGSVLLSLVREGESESGWTWSTNGTEAGQVAVREVPERKTKKITIHTSGRINYHFSNHAPRFVPCLLDLEGPAPVVRYVVPTISSLDAAAEISDDDHVVTVPDDVIGHCWFEFVVLPVLAPPLDAEVMRLGIEGLFAIACAAGAGDAGTAREEIPAAAFTTLVPSSVLPTQAISEEVVFLRFKKAMYAHDVHAAVRNSAEKETISPTEVEALIQRGPGLFPPNKEGIWTFIASVPMRVAPRLDVVFEDDRYRAEVVELRPGDTRLETVRVRFRVFDQTTGSYVKKPVGILSIALDAEL